MCNNDHLAYYDNDYDNYKCDHDDQKWDHNDQKWDHNDQKCDHDHDDLKCNDNDYGNDKCDYDDQRCNNDQLTYYDNYKCDDDNHFHADDSYNFIMIIWHIMFRIIHDHNNDKFHHDDLKHQEYDNDECKHDW